MSLTALRIRLYDLGKFCVPFSSSAAFMFIYFLIALPCFSADMRHLYPPLELLVECKMHHNNALSTCDLPTLLAPSKAKNCLKKMVVLSMDRNFWICIDCIFIIAPFRTSPQRTSMRFRSPVHGHSGQRGQHTQWCAPQGRRAWCHP